MACYHSRALPEWFTDYSRLGECEEVARLGSSNHDSLKCETSYCQALRRVQQLVHRMQQVYQAISNDVPLTHQDLQQSSELIAALFHADGELLFVSE